MVEVFCIKQLEVTIAILQFYTELTDECLQYYINNLSVL